MNIPSFIHSQRGSVLLTVMAMLAVMTIVAGSVLETISQEYILSKRSVAWNQSLSTAETGIEIGWNELNKLTAVNTNGVFMAGSNWTFVSTGVWNLSTQTLTPASGSEAATSYTVNVNTNNWTLTATGTATSTLINSAVSRSVVVQIKPTTPFEWALLSKGGLNFNGNNPLVDSWNSVSDGNYNSASNRRTNGDVGTDGSLITAAGSEIYGSVMTGPGGVVTTAPGFNMYSDSTSRNGTNTISDGLEVYIPSVQAPWAKGATGIPTATTANLAAISGTQSYEMGSVNGDITVAGSGTLILYVDSISQHGNDGVFIQPTAGSTLNVILYVKNSLTLTGNDGVNEKVNPADSGTTGRAANLQIYCLPTCTSVDIGGNKAFVGSLYAPDASVTIHGTAEFFGSLVANNITISGTPDFHYDESLDTTGGIVGFSLVSWRER